MGNSSWSTQAYTNYASTTRGKSVDQIFTKRSKDVRFDPKNIVLRESRDSEANPNSTPVILGIDVTGSMGVIGQVIAQKGLGELAEGLLNTKPISDPHIMIMGIGDVHGDYAPLQVTQFEADIRIAEQLKDIYVEGGGCGNGSESYHLPWYFAAFKTSIDCFEKRNVKGYCFTIGDEAVPPTLTKNQISQVLKDSGERDYTAKELYELASEKYNVFHLIVEQGGYCSSQKNTVVSSWKNLIGGRAILLSEYTHLASVILAVIRVSEGESPETVTNSFEDKSVRETVRHALFD